MNDEEYVRIVNKYIGDVKRVAFVCCKDDYDSDDITQIVFMKLREYTGSFENDEHIKRWLIRVAVNECRSLWKSPWKEKVDYYIPERMTVMKQLSDTDELLLKALGKLKKQYRDVIYLYYYEEYSTSEIADILEISESAVQKRIQRARAKIKAYMTKTQAKV